MKVFSKVINDKTKQLDCIVCGDTSVLEDYSELEREIGYDGSWYLQGYAPEKPQEVKEDEGRAVRNSYLETYVDPKQLVMVWNSLTAEEQELYKDYRQYLLDYPQTEKWYEQNPDDLKTFAEKRRKATETIK
jgi:hypothetical protein